MWEQGFTCNLKAGPQCTPHLPVLVVFSDGCDEWLGVLAVRVGQRDPCRRFSTANVTTGCRRLRTIFINNIAACLRVRWRLRQIFEDDFALLDTHGCDWSKFLNTFVCLSKRECRSLDATQIVSSKDIKLTFTWSKIPRPHEPELGQSCTKHTKI